MHDIVRGPLFQGTQFRASQTDNIKRTVKPSDTSPPKTGAHLSKEAEQEPLRLEPSRVLNAAYRNFSNVGLFLQIALGPSFSFSYFAFRKERIKNRVTE